MIVDQVTKLRREEVKRTRYEEGRQGTGVREGYGSEGKVRGRGDGGEERRVAGT